MPALRSLLIRARFHEAALAVIVDRRRSRLHPSRGRFSHHDTVEILDTAWRFAHADPDLGFETATIARALVDALVLREVERPYAIELTGDVVARVGSARGPDVCPLTLLGAGTHVVEHCPIAQHLHAHDADDVCRAVFCDAAYATGEANGLQLRRMGTIADGSPSCEARWSKP